MDTIKYTTQVPKALDHAVEQGWITSWTVYSNRYRLVYNDNRVSAMTPEMAAGWFEGVAYAMNYLARTKEDSLSTTT